jgi:hypothetical protein
MKNCKNLWNNWSFRERVIVSGDSRRNEGDLGDGHDQLGLALGVLAVAVGRVVDPFAVLKE